MASFPSQGNLCGAQSHTLTSTTAGLHLWTQFWKRRFVSGDWPWCGLGPPLPGLGTSSGVSVYFWGQGQGRGLGSGGSFVVLGGVGRAWMLCCPCGPMSWSFLGHLYVGWFVADDFPVTRWRKPLCQDRCPLWPEDHVAPQSPQPWWTSGFLSTKGGGGGWGWQVSVPSWRWPALGDLWCLPILRGCLVQFYLCVFCFASPSGRYFFKMCPLGQN